MDNKRNEFLKVYNEFCEREYEEVSLKKLKWEHLKDIMTIC